MSKEAFKTYKDSRNYKVNYVKDYNLNKSFENAKRDNRQYFFNSAGIVFRLMLLIFFGIIFLRVFWVLRGSSNTVNFTGFLEFLSNLNSVDINVSVSNFVIGGDWGVFEFLRNFFNIFAQLFGVIVWLFSNIVNVLNYVLQFIFFLFS